jgi:hypothetical protein
MSLTRSKTVAVLFALVICTAIAAWGMYQIKVRGLVYGDPRMVNVLRSVQLLLSVVIGFSIRFFTWYELGFRRLRPRQLFWLVPSSLILLILGVIFFRAFVLSQPETSQWQLLGSLAFTTLLVGFFEELLFRGIVLHAFLKTRRVLWAMFFSAVTFWYNPQRTLTDLAVTHTIYNLSELEDIL